MIDNYDEAMELVRKMEAALPIPARPSKMLVQGMRERGEKIKLKRNVQIEKVFYLGDEGGIMCGVKLPEQAETAVVVSLTHIRVKFNHPLVREIRAYQLERTKKLAQIQRRGLP